jgi:hypothetical protein
MDSQRLLHDLQQLPDNRIKHTLVRKTIAGAYHCPTKAEPHHSLLDDLNHPSTQHLQDYALQGRYDTRSPHNPHQLAQSLRTQAQPSTPKKTESDNSKETKTKGEAKVETA